MKKGIQIGIICIIISISIFLLYISIDYENSFENIKKEFQSGNYELYSNLSKIPKEYYLKPEFYTTYGMYKGIKKQKGTYGYGALPSKLGYNVTKFKEGQYLDIYTFVISSYDVGNYQGIGLNLTSPDDKLFETYINPSDILLHPIILGDPERQSDWVYMIQMKIIAKKDIPEGEYIFRLKTREPDSERQKEFYNITQNLGGNYVNIGPIRPADFFDFMLNVY